MGLHLIKYQHQVLVLGINGVINITPPNDGWWCEFYSPTYPPMMGGGVNSIHPPILGGEVEVPTALHLFQEK